MEPLANRIRPDKLNNFVGQLHLTEREGLLYLAYIRNFFLGLTCQIW